MKAEHDRLLELAGIDPDDVRKAMGGNALRVIRQGMVPYAQLSAQTQAAR